MTLQVELTGIETRTTFYTGLDGKRRAIVLGRDYARLVRLAQKRVKGGSGGKKRTLPGLRRKARHL